MKENIRKAGFIFLLSFLVSTGFSQNADKKEYRINWIGLGKKGYYTVSKPGEKHTITLGFDKLGPGEVYEVEVFFNDKKIDTISSNKVFTDTPTTAGKYSFYFYKVEKGQRVKTKPKVIKGSKRTKVKKSRPREGIRVTSSSSGGTVTATVDA